MSLPAPVYVKKDGTLLVSAPRGNRADPHDACTSHPNPCSIFPAKPKCSHFDHDLVKCSGNYALVNTLGNLFHSGATNHKLRLRWIDPTDETDDSQNKLNTINEVDMRLVPAVNYEGSPCNPHVLVPGVAPGIKLL